MTIKDLKALFPNEKRWVARKNGFPNWNYKDSDIVVDYEVKEIEETDITDALFKKNGEIKKRKVEKVYLNWTKGESL